MDKNIPEHKNPQLIKKIVFFGGAEIDLKIHAKEFQLAYDTAALLAEHGFTVVDGGGPGIMYAASLGAKSKGGKTIGVTLHSEGASNFEESLQGDLLDKEIHTVNYLYRTMRLLQNGDAYVIFKGGTGTLSEFAMAWVLSRIYFNRHKSMILVGDYWNDIIANLEKNLLIRPEEKSVFKVVEEPKDVLKCVQEFEKDAQANNFKPHKKYKDSLGFVL